MTDTELLREALKALGNLYGDSLESWTPHLDVDCGEDSCFYMQEAQSVIAKLEERLLQE